MVLSHWQEFDYDVTILAFNIRVQLLTPDYLLAKGYGSGVTFSSLGSCVQLSTKVSLTPNNILTFLPPSLPPSLSSPELHNLQPGKPVVISSEFPCWQDEKGQSKGGMMLFKLGTKKGKKNPPKEIKVRWHSESTITLMHAQKIKLVFS